MEEAESKCSSRARPGGPGLCCLSSSWVPGLEQTSWKLPCLVNVSSLVEAGPSQQYLCRAVKVGGFSNGPTASAWAGLSLARLPGAPQGPSAGDTGQVLPLGNGHGALAAERALARAILNPLGWGRGRGVCARRAQLVFLCPMDGCVLGRKKIPKDPTSLKARPGFLLSGSSLCQRLS